MMSCDTVEDCAHAQIVHFPLRNCVKVEDCAHAMERYVLLCTGEPG